MNNVKVLTRKSKKKVLYMKRNVKLVKIRYTRMVKIQYLAAKLTLKRVKNLISTKKSTIETEREFLKSEHPIFHEEKKTLLLN